MQKSSRERPIFKKQLQSPPGLEFKMDPQPEFDNKTAGSNKLQDRKCIISGGDSGIGRAVAIAFAKQGADVAIIYLPGEKEDADFTATYIREKYKKQCLKIPADISSEKNCQKAIDKILQTYPKLDVLVNNAAVQFPEPDITRITTEQLTKTFAVNIFAMFWLTKAVLPHLNKGGCIINTTSVTAYRGSLALLDYSATKGAIVSFTRSLSSNLIEKGIRVNGVAAGPVWTPLIPSTFGVEKITKFGTDTPMKRPAQPVEVAPAYVFLASGDASYITGQILHVNGGEIING